MIEGMKALISLTIAVFLVVMLLGLFAEYGFILGALVVIMSLK